MDSLCIFKIKIESQNFELWFMKDQWPYPYQGQDDKPQSGTSSILQSPKSGVKGHGCSLHLQNQDRDPNLEHGCIKDQWPYPNQDQNAKLKPGTSKAPNEDLKDMDALCTFKIKIESQNLEYGCTKDQWPYQNQYLDAKPQSGLEGHWCSLHL